jgi:hypothetical protein
MLSIPIISEFSDAGVKRAIKEFKQLGTAGEKAQFAIKKAAVPAGIAVAALGGFFVKAAKNAESARQANQRLGNVLDSMGFAEATDRVSAFAESLEKTIAVDADVIKATQTVLATFGQLAKTADTVGGSFDRATVAALDMAAAGFGTAESNAVQLGKALENPIKGIAALAKSGVTFTEQEKEKIKVLVESGKLLEAQDIVLQAIEKQVGGTADASASSFDKMKFAIEGVADTFGQMLLPVIDDLAPKLAEFSAWATDNPELLKIAAAAIFGLAASIVAVNVAMSLNPFVIAATGIVAMAIGFNKLADAMDRINKIGGFAARLLGGLVFPIVGQVANILKGAGNFVNPSDKPSGKPSGPSSVIEIPKMAAGGIITNGPQLAMIGEAGPEAVIPLSRMGQMGGNYTINVQGGISSSADIGEAVVNAIRAYNRAAGPANIAVA